MENSHVVCAVAFTQLVVVTVGPAHGRQSSSKKVSSSWLSTRDYSGERLPPTSTLHCQEELGAVGGRQLLIRTSNKKSLEGLAR